MDVKTLDDVPLFEKLSKKDRKRIAQWADEIDEPAGYHMLDQGRLAHEFFVLLEGTVEVRQDGNHLTDLGPGDFFGEIALVEHERRTASIMTTTPVRAIVMHARDFDAMRAQMPEVASAIESAIRARLAR